jgi:AraC-like DNA-binding protein
MSADPIADVIGLLRPRTVGGCLHASGSWAVRYEPFPHVRFGTVARGEAWLVLEGRKPVPLREGDFFLLGNPPQFTIGSGVTVRPRSARALLAASPDGGIRIGPSSEADTFICGGHFAFDDPNAPLLLDVLPTLVHVRPGDPRSRHFASLSDLLVAEVETSAPGSALVIDRLAHVFLVHMLRAHADGPTRPAGWLGALRDDRLGATLRAMHAELGHRWTLDELAKLAGMSRSAFAASFKSQVGTSPLDYLIAWRMNVARDALRHDTRRISELASELGYGSESAFSTAFRRVVGASPKHFRAETR